MTHWFIIREKGLAPRNLVYRIKGAMGTGSIVGGGLGKIYELNMTLSGIWVGNTELTTAQARALTGAESSIPEKLLNTYLTTEATAVGDGSITGGVAEFINSFTLDFGNTVAPIGDQSSASGYDHFMIVDSNPTFACDPLKQRIAVEDIDSIMSAGTAKAIQLKSASTNPHIVINAPRCQLQAFPALADRDTQITESRVYDLLRNNNGTSANDSGLADECQFEITIGDGTRT
jgi:hypothetical protein